MAPPSSPASSATSSPWRRFLRFPARRAVFLHLRALAAEPAQVGPHARRRFSDGLVHVSELDVKKGTNLQKVFKRGDKMSVVVQGVDAKNKRISLTTSSSAEQDLETKKYLADNANDNDGETYNPFAALLKK